jgi:hypothetical protein
MLIHAKRVDSVLGVHLQKVYKTAPADSTAKVTRTDFATISKLSQLVERGRARALVLPEVRADLVAKARNALLEGKQPEAKEIARQMIQRVLEGLE